MATLKVTFDGTNPPPANGYKVTYAPVGSTAFDTVIPNPTTTTVYIPNVLNGTDYTVRVQNDCGNGNLGPVVEFTIEAPTCAGLQIASGSGVISYKRCDGTAVNNLTVSSGTPISDCIRQNSLQILSGSLVYNWTNACVGTIV